MTRLYDLTSGVYLGIWWRDPSRTRAPWFAENRAGELHRFPTQLAARLWLRNQPKPE